MVKPNRLGTVRARATVDPSVRLPIVAFTGDDRIHAIEASAVASKHLRTLAAASKQGDLVDATGVVLQIDGGLIRPANEERSEEDLRRRAQRCVEAAWLRAKQDRPDNLSEKGMEEVFEEIDRLTKLRFGDMASGIAKLCENGPDEPVPPVRMVARAVGTGAGMQLRSRKGSSSRSQSPTQELSAKIPVKPHNGSWWHNLFGH